jgi:hypothetical protein
MPRNLYDRVSLYDSESPDAPEPEGGYNVTRPWQNGMRKAAPRTDAKEREAAMARLGGGAVEEEEPIDLTSDKLMDNAGLSATQEWALSSKYSPQELQKLRDEIGADPQAFGANRFGSATAEFNGKKYKLKSFSTPSTKRAANWVDYERNESRERTKREENQRQREADTAKANVPVRVAEVAAGSEEKRLAAEIKRQETQDAILAQERERNRLLQDEVRERNKGLLDAQAKAAALDVNQGQSEKQRRVGEKLGRIGREELTGLEFNQDEQRAVMARLAGQDPDLAGLDEGAYLRRPTAEMAEREYSTQIDELGTFLEDNWLDVTEADQRNIRTKMEQILKRAQADLTPGQLARFKQKVNATLGSKIKGGWFNSDSARRTSLRAALGF